MNTPTGRREALEVLTRRGLSQRKACRYLGLSRRVATYELKQPEKDRRLGAHAIPPSPARPPDNGVEFTAAKFMRCLRDAAIGPAFIAPGSPGKTASSKASMASCATSC